MKDPKRRRRFSMGTLTTGVRKDRRDGEFHEFWVYRYFDPQVGKNGNRPRLSLTVGRTDEMTRDEALRQVEPFRMMANTERPFTVVVMMRELVRRYIQEILEPCFVPLGGVQSETARMSDGCAKAYRCELINWVEPMWGAYDVREFERPETWASVESWLYSLQRSPEHPGREPGGLPHLFNAMRQVFKWGVKWGYLNLNPLADDRVELPRGTTSQRQRKKAPQITCAQFFLLLDNLELLPRVAVALAGWLGSRRSEPFGLKWKDLNFDDAKVELRQGFVAGRVTLLKTRASRTFEPIPEDVVELLRKWKSVTPYALAEDWVFASPYTKGKRPYDPHTMMNKQIRPVALKLGLPKISWHSFRHTLSRWAKAVCKRLEDAKELLRHEDITTTSNIYGGMSLEEKREIQQQVVRYVYEKAKSEGWTGSTVSTTKKHTRKQSARKENRAS
jgi:integrase